MIQNNAFGLAHSMGVKALSKGTNKQNSVVNNSPPQIKHYYTTGGGVR